MTQEYDEKRQELIKDAKQTKEELEAKQAEALKEIETGQELERYETVQLGNLDLEVKAWIPGGMVEDINHANNLAQRNDPQAMMDSINTMLSVLEDMTTDPTYSMAFWRQHFQKWGPEGLQSAVETVLEPAQDRMEDKQDALDGFRPNVEGKKPSTRNGTNGPHSG